MKLKTKLLSLVLVLLLILPMAMPLFVFETEAATANSSASDTTNKWDGTIATSFAGGKGTVRAPYQIATGAQLAYFAQLLNDPATYSTYYKKCYILTANIDLNNREWTPIGGQSYLPVDGVNMRFEGVFDGDGHSITNLYMAEKKPVGAGLFGILSSASIKNLTVSGRITAGAVYDSTNSIPGCGMLAVASYGAMFENVNVYANIDIRSTDTNRYYVGGFYGYGAANENKFTNCNVYGTISVKLSDSSVTVGGFASHMRRGTFTNCHSDVDIYVRDSGQTTYVGGLIGYSYANSGMLTEIVTINGCRFTGNLYAHVGNANVYMGGLVGHAGCGISETEPDYTKGGTCNISNCFYDGTMKVDCLGESIGKMVYQGAMVGQYTAYKATIQNCFSATDDPLYTLKADYLYDGSDLTFTDKGGHIKNIYVNSDYGAAIRLAKSSTGMRFNSSIKKELYNTLTAATGITVKLGTLIAPTSYVEEADGFTKDKLENYAAKMGYATPYVDVTFTPGTNEWLDEYYNDSTSHFFSGAMSDIAQENYNRTFSGVGYVEITSGGYTHRFYADYYDTSSARTAAYVAMRANTDRSATKTGIYRYLTSDNNYSPYSPLQLERIQGFAAYYDANAMDLADLTIIENGTSKYSIVYPLGLDGVERELAVTLQQAIYFITGVLLPVRENCITAQTTPYEIVVGCSEQANAYNVRVESFEKEYLVFAGGKRVIILGDTDAALSAGVRAFVNKVFGVNLATATSLTRKSTTTFSYPKFQRLNESGITANPATVNLSSYTLVYTSGNALSQRAAYSFQQTYMNAKGSKLSMATSASNKNKIVFTADPTFTKGDFKITTSVSGNYTTITVKAGTYYGFEGAEDFLMAQAKYGLQPITKSGFTYAGNFSYWVSGTERSSQYAYNQAGDVRVMFNNILFNNSTGRLNESGQTWKDVPTGDRNCLQVEMFQQYMPDVIGCQEFNESKRSGAGDSNLATLLANIGYVEAIDPRVKNSYSTSTNIPGTDNGAVTGTVDTLDRIKGTLNHYDNDYNREYANKISGTKIKGYGTGSATKVTYGGSTFYTYYNNTPLFYNPTTTTLVHAEYYWYKYQTDARTYADCTLCQNGTHTSEDDHHYNSANDAASKSATWGVFQDKATGKQYAVISTHMCTRSNYIRLLQSRELLTLIETIKSTYNCPIFLGGDMNGDYNDMNYRTFIDEGNYRDIAKDECATQFSDELGTTHGYPSLDTTTGMMLPYPGTMANYDSNCIDCIFGINDDQISYKVLGVIADDRSESSSDHLPIFIDFSFVIPSDDDEYSKRY